MKEKRAKSKIGYCKPKQRAAACAGSLLITLKENRDVLQAHLQVFSNRFQLVGAYVAAGKGY